MTYYFELLMILKITKIKYKKPKLTKQVTIILSLNNWYTPCRYSLLSENLRISNKHFIAPVKINTCIIFILPDVPLNLQLAASHLNFFLTNTEIYIK